MAEAIMNFIINPRIKTSCFQSTKVGINSPFSKKLQHCSSLSFSNGSHPSKRGSLSRVNAWPDWPMMVVLVEHIEGQRDFISHKSIWHLNEQEIKNVYTLYIMFTVWGCCFFGSTKDPYYDSEEYRKDGGDGTGHWLYEKILIGNVGKMKQDDIEEKNRAELWREELIEEIEQKIGGLRELEEAGKEKVMK